MPWIGLVTNVLTSANVIAVTAGALLESPPVLELSSADVGSELLVGSDVSLDAAGVVVVGGVGGVTVVGGVGGLTVVGGVGGLVGGVGGLTVDVVGDVVLVSADVNVSVPLVWGPF